MGHLNKLIKRALTKAGRFPGQARKRTLELTGRDPGGADDDDEDDAPLQQARRKKASKRKGRRASNTDRLGG